MPFYFLHQPSLTNKALKGIQKSGMDHIVASPSFEENENIVRYYNRAFLVLANGSVVDTYDKAHLVPFGEYVPVKKWLPFLGKMVGQVGDFSAGETGRTLKWRDHKLGMLICYELIFPYLSRAVAKNGAELLINITNDAWYGKSSAPYQHFSMAVFRAVENRKALVRSANTGVSGFIDPAGRIRVATPIFEEAAITVDVPMLQQVTLYTHFGDFFALVCLTLSILFLIRRFHHVFGIKTDHKRS
jgi:apolipoprotein N-acyltransferase